MTVETIGSCKIFNCDCLEIMPQYENNYFDLAIVDPPYGFNAGCSGIKKSKKKMKIYNDIPPDTEYFKQLFRISKNQIIFGGNLFDEVPRRSGFIFWDKNNHYKVFSDGELIWLSCEKKIRKYTFDMGYSRGFDYENRIHPNEKPIEIYKWLLSEYAKPGYKILDTHLGSGSSAIACYDMGFSLIASEIDNDYFTAAIKRIKDFAAQGVFIFEGNNDS
jgi:site-specific DNA-methyltransferase (adenine-specific)